VAIAAGWRHSIAVTGEGAVFVWGCGSDGRLGVGEYTDVQRPQQVRVPLAGLKVRSVSAGDDHSSAVTAA
ncbi:unnamed protein product, partial [Sphacelaria rigidula]